MIRRTDDGAVKCALRDFRREEDTAADRFIADAVSKRRVLLGKVVRELWQRLAGMRRREGRRWIIGAVVPTATAAGVIAVMRG